jgi:phosphoadenosine phosphosulfate reductase
VAQGAPDPEGPIWQAGAFHRDAWTKADGEAELPDGPVIVPKTRWLAERGTIARRNAPLGLVVAPSEALDDIAADLPRFALVALAFPKFTDGRAYSLARLLREKYGYGGELRAVGNVLSDQLQSMRRVGFDSFEVSHAPTRQALAEDRIPEVRLYYQPTGTDAPPDGTRPWLRRHAR